MMRLVTVFMLMLRAIVMTVMLMFGLVAMALYVRIAGCFANGKGGITRKMKSTMKSKSIQPHCQSNEARNELLNCRSHEA